MTRDRKAQAAGEMKKPKNQSRRKSTSQTNLNEPTEVVLTRQQAAQLTPQTRSKDKVNKLVKKGELYNKSKNRKVREQKKKKVLLNLKKDRSKSDSFDKMLQKKKLINTGTSSSSNQTASPQKLLRINVEYIRSTEKVNSVNKSGTGSGNLTLTACKSKSLLDNSKIMLDKELRAARKQIIKPIHGSDGPEECFRKGLNGTKDTNEESTPQGLIENEGRCPGFDKFGRPMTDIPDIVIMKEELEDIDEDDIMDIVLCPSPVWWEEPVDEDLKAMYKKEGEPQQKTYSTAPEVQNQGSSNSSGSKKKSFTLEKVLENIRQKNVNSGKKNGISYQNNPVSTAIDPKTGSENRDFENKIGNVTGNISENTSDSVLGTNLNFSENILSEDFIATDVNTEKVVSDFKTTSVNCSSVHEHRKTLLEDTTDGEVAGIMPIAIPGLEERSSKNEKDTKTCTEQVVDLTLDDNDDDSEMSNFDPVVAEIENLDLKLLNSALEMESHIFEKNKEQNENNSAFNSCMSTENCSKTKPHKEIKIVAKCSKNYNHDVKSVNFKYFEKEREVPLSVVEIDEYASVEETNLIEELDGELTSDENELEHREATDLVSEDFDNKEILANIGHNSLIIKDITTRNTEEVRTSKLSSAGGCDNIETESVLKEPTFKTEPIMTGPIIEIDIGNVILEKNITKVIIEKDLNGEKKSLRKEGNEVEEKCIDKMAATFDEEINVNIVVANAIKQENFREKDSGGFTECLKNINEVESVNLVQIPIKNEHIPGKTEDAKKNISQNNVAKSSCESLNENSTLNVVTTIELSDLDEANIFKIPNSEFKSTQKTVDTETQKKMCDQELNEIDTDSENSETSINVPNVLSTSTENKELNVSVETEKCTESENPLSSETNVEKSEDKAKKIREEMKVMEEGLRMAQHIQKLSESGIDSSKRNKLLELSSELLETLKSSMHELKFADVVSETPAVSENKNSDGLEIDNQKETIMRKSSEKNVELENITNQNTEEIAVCTMVSDNLKKQVKESDFIARSQKIRNTYLGIVGHESSYKKNQINPTRKSDIVSNSENDGRKQSISVSTNISYNSPPELSTNKSSIAETHLIAPTSRRLSILKDFSFSAEEIQKLALNCESIDTSSEVSSNDPICGATPISTSPRADFLENYLPSDASKICEVDNSRNFSCSRSVAEIPQESAKRLPSISGRNIAENVNTDVSLNSIEIKPGKKLKVIDKFKNRSGDFRRKNAFVPKHLNNINTEIKTHGKSKTGKFRNLRISKKRNVRMKSTSPLKGGSATLQENIDQCEKKIPENSTGNLVSVSFVDKSYESNKLESKTSHNIEQKTENENSENDSSYDDILKSLQSLIDENNGSAIVIENSVNEESEEIIPEVNIEVYKPNNSQSSLNLNGSEIALADLKAIANGQNRNIIKLSPQKYVEMDKLVILDTAFKSTSISNISKDFDFGENQKQHYVEMNSLLIMNNQKDTLTPELEELVPIHENSLDISNDSLKKIREILGIPEFDCSPINLHSLEESFSEKSYTESIDGNLNGENGDEKLVECNTRISLECTETFDPKMDLCDTLGVPYLEYPRGATQNDVKHKSLLDFKDEVTKLHPLEAVVNNVGKENLNYATKTRDVRAKRKRIDYKQLSKGIRTDSSEISVKRIKTVNNKDTSDADVDTKSLTRDMIANIIGVNAAAGDADKVDNIYLNIDPNLYKNTCKHRKSKSETRCQKCILRFTYDSCIKLLTNSQSDSDSKFADDKSVTCNELYKCGQCDYVCARRDNLRTHFRKHTDERPYDCDVCDHRARTKDHLTRHQRTHDNLPKDDWRKSHREAQRMISESAVKMVPEEVFRDHSYARH